MSETEVNYTENTMMAYIDILGFKEIVLKKNLKEIVEMMEEISKADNSSKYSRMLKIETKLVSDALVVFAKVEKPIEFTAFFTYLGSIVAKIHIEHKILTRGCIANGLHYSTEKYWISPTFINAYEGESKDAIYPRVILHETAMRRLKVQFLKIFNGGTFRLDNDGYFFLDYLSSTRGVYEPEEDRIIVNLSMRKDDSTPLFTYLKAHKAKIQEGLGGGEEFRKKYIWLANYHNAFVEKDINLKNKIDLMIASDKLFII